MILFCNIWKDGISFFQKILYFLFRRKMKEDDFYQKTSQNMTFFVCMRRRISRGIILQPRKQRCPQKIHLRVTSPASTKKMIFILDSPQIHPISAEIPHSLTSQKGPTKQPLEMFSEKITGKDLCQGLFFNEATGLGPATLLKRRLWRKCFPVSFCENSKNTFFTERSQAATSGVRIILCSFFQTFLYIALQ